MKLVKVGFAPFCGRCRNPFGIVQDGQTIEIGPAQRRFGESIPRPAIKALCPGFASGAHDVWWVAR